MGIEVVREIERLEGALGRSFALADIQQPSGWRQTWRIVQRCPVCRIDLALTLEIDERQGDTPVTTAWLRGELFALYDLHRCQRSLVEMLARPPDGVLEELYERTERESVLMAERALAIEDPALRARAERESNQLLDWAMAIHRKITGA